MTERPYVTSVDLGELADACLKDIERVTGLSRSECIRYCVIITKTMGLHQVRRDTIAAIEKGTKVPTRRKLGSMTEGDKAIVATYRAAFNFKGRIHAPAVMRCIRKLEAGGLNTQDICELIAIAPQDELLQNRTPALNEILTDKMINRFEALKEGKQDEGRLRREVELRDQIKPRALSRLKQLVSGDLRSIAWGLVNEATSEAEVNRVVHVCETYEGSALESNLKGLKGGREETPTG